MKRKNKKNVSILLSALCVSFGLAGATLFQPVEVEQVKADNDALISLTNGARAKVLSAESSGLRFDATVNAEKFAALKENASNVEAGIIIVPTDYITESATLETLETQYGVGNIVYETYATEQDFELLEDGNYAFSLNIMVEEENYMRPFTGLAFVRITPNDEASVGTEYDEYADSGVYYTYATATPSRTVYYVATRAWEDRKMTAGVEDYDHIVVTDEGETTYATLPAQQMDNLQKYLDAVAPVTYDENNKEVALEEIDFYTSPYSFVESGNGYVLSGDPKFVSYQGEVVEDFPIKTPNGKNVNMFRMNDKVTYDGETVTMTSKAVNNADDTTLANTLDQLDENIGGYVAYEGEYGVNTYIDMEFTGNNMPVVRLFANTIDGYITKTVNAEAKGIVIVNGARTEAVKDPGNQYFQCMRLYYDMVTVPWGASGSVMQAGNAYSWVSSSRFGSDRAKGDAFGMACISKDTSIQWKYTVGTFEEADGTLVIAMELYKWNGSEYELVESRSKNTGIQANTYTASNIVILSAMLREGVQNKVKISAPYTKAFNELANLGSDIIVKGDGTTMWAWPDDVQDNYKSSGTAIYLDQTTTGYVGYENYTVGKYLDFEFTGNNMPSVRFFADEINGYFTKNIDTDAKGIVVINGARTTNYKPDNKYHQYMRVYFDMVGDSNWTSYPRNDVNGGFSWHSTWFSLSDDTRPDQFSMKYLKANSTTNFKYTVGTYLCDDGTVGVHMLLYKEVEGAWEFIEERAVNTGKTMDFYTGTNVVVLQPKNGDFPTAKITKPYVGEFDMVLNNAVRKADGSIQMGTELVSSDWNPNNSALGNYYGVGKSYVGFDGNYGAGTYVDIEFYGKNMPIVRLFADQINGLFPTGTEGDASGAYFKPGRWTGKYNQFGVLYKGTAYKEGNDWAPAGNAALCLQNLDANLYYKYTVGSYLDTDGTLVFEFHLYSKATVDGEYVEITYSEADGCDIVNTYDTGKTMEELGFTAGDIVIMPFLEGAAKKDRFNNFSVSAPYTK